MKTSLPLKRSVLIENYEKRILPTLVCRWHSADWLSITDFSPLPIWRRFLKGFFLLNEKLVCVFISGILSKLIGKCNTVFSRRHHRCHGLAANHVEQRQVVLNPLLPNKRLCQPTALRVFDSNMARCKTQRRSTDSPVTGRRWRHSISSRRHIFVFQKTIVQFELSKQQ